MMLNSQFNQYFTFFKISISQGLIKFCYFTIILMLISCVDSNQKETKNSKVKEEHTANTSKNQNTKTILCFGDSITAGYGLEDTDEAYPNLIQQKIDTLQLDYRVINSGLSGETTAGGKSRISWVLNQKVDVFLLELGANDGLRGVPLSETKANLQSIINSVQEKNPDAQIILAGMQLPPNMGQDYTTEFRELFEDLANSNTIEFIPFILENVGGIEELNQKDGIHPNEKGHQIVAENVWKILKPLITSH